MADGSSWDVIVIGGGHAGCEAAHAAARLGCRTALLTLNPARIGFMSCNPAMGGLAKGQLIKEIDALGGIMGRITDRAAIQYRRLNASKGPAVRSSRAQCDKAAYAAEMQRFLAGIPNLVILGLEAVNILSENSQVVGVGLRDGSELRARQVVVTSGTFMRAVMHTGFERERGGRVGDASSEGLSGSLERLGFRLRRLKTGTPPRLHRKSIDFARLEEQPGDRDPVAFSFYHRPDPFPFLPQVGCHITYTNERTHEIIEKNFSRSPMFTGVIQGLGPRYCPSIEDKVKRFRDRTRHQIFLEPEGLHTDEIYVNGISTSLPKDVQDEFVHSIEGLEHAEFTRYGYAVEYDAIDATQLRAPLEAKNINGLYLAGQVNGTSGYEEAGAQGLVAGLNAARRAKERDPVLIARSDGYVGVLVDDLILKGADEPYRMFTSRAEFRLLLREDNADQRLGAIGHEAGLLGDEEWALLGQKRAEIESARAALRGHYFRSGGALDVWLRERGLSELKDRVSAEALLRRPEVTWSTLCDLGFEGRKVGALISEQVEIDTKYEGYIRRDLELLEGVKKSESVRIPFDVEYDRIAGLSNEVRERLKQTRPETLGQAARMAGTTPAAVANLMIYLKTREARA